MKIETKFDVNNLVVSKYKRNPISAKSMYESVCCYEVIDIQTGTCMAGTQVFYDLRTIHGIMTETEYVDGKKVTKFTDFAIGSSSKSEYIRIREDELIEAPQDVIDMVLGNS